MPNTFDQFGQPIVVMPYPNPTETDKESGETDNLTTDKDTPKEDISEEEQPAVHISGVSFFELCYNFGMIIIIYFRVSEKTQSILQSHPSLFHWTQKQLPTNFRLRVKRDSPLRI